MRASAIFPARETAAGNMILSRKVSTVKRILSLAVLLLAGIFAVAADDDTVPQKDGFLLGRRIEFFHQKSKPEWGYEAPQVDSFGLIHPEEYSGRAPLYVIFHSAGHDLYSSIGCTWQEGNHDIYHSPADSFALFLDCRANAGDWWWGGIDADEESDWRARTALQPVEKRVIDTVKWVVANYPVDPERVYAVGNSMGGSGALGIALRHGDIFAAVKVNVPAGIRHAADRCCLDVPVPAGFAMPDPPVVVDYSAQNDYSSRGHEVFYQGMRDKKYAVLGFWGPFGHANNHARIAEVNDLIQAFDIRSVVRNAAYPVFTDA